MRKIFTIALILVILAAGIFLAIEYLDQIKSIAGSLASRQIDQIVISKENITEKEVNKADNYTTEVTYPVFSGIRDSQAKEDINAHIKSSVFAVAESFKNDARENCDFSKLGDNAPDWTCEFYALPEAYNVIDRILSVRMEYYRFTGGAHGATNYVYLNYNLSTGKPVEWNSVFKSDSEYLKKISDFSRDYLIANITKGDNAMTNEEWVKEGTEPKSDNYNTNVGFNDFGIIILFQQYQVAAYAAGPQEVTIPYPEFKDFIDPAGPLSAKLN